MRETAALRPHFAPDGPVGILAVDVAATPLLVELEKLRGEERLKKFLKGSPWPLEMFFWVVAPQRLARLGFEHTVAIDADVFALDGRIAETRAETARRDTYSRPARRHRRAAPLVDASGRLPRRRTSSST